MKKVFVLGAAGMLGHKLLQGLSAGHEVVGSIRGKAADHPAGPGFLADYNLVEGLDVSRPDAVAEALAREAPDVVLNCIGIIKQRPQSDDPATSIALNALFPHLLADACGDLGARLITFGTDCVFKGDRGGYTEDDHGDANDLYGRTKLLGELRDRTNALTLRTSIVGRELTTFQSLIEWLISQEGRTISGYRKAIFTGLTTNQVANVVGRLIVDAPDLQGLFHLAGPVISKHDLLAVVRDALGLNIEIEADDEFVIDRSLDGSRFVEATGIESPSWESMIAEMAADPTPYHLWR